jgi:hypothetical protein
VSLPLDPESRRAWSFMSILGGCIVMTFIAVVGVYLIRHDAKAVFWLTLAAHAQIMVGMTAQAALLVKRTIKVTRDGIDITDNGGVQ